MHAARDRVAGRGREGRGRIPVCGVCAHVGAGSDMCKLILTVGFLRAGRVATLGGTYTRVRWCGRETDEVKDGARVLRAGLGGWGGCAWGG